MMFRSHSHDLLNSSESPSPTVSSSIANIFTLNTSDLNCLKCQICQDTIIQPTQLPCRHTFCMKCIKNQLKTKSNSWTTSMYTRFSATSLTTNCHTNLPSLSYFKCVTCFKLHKIQSIEDLKENSSLALLINTLCCDVCHQISEFQQLDTCLHCYGVLCPQCYEKHQTSDFHALTPKRKVTFEFLLNNQQSSSILYQIPSLNENFKDGQQKQLRKRQSETTEENDVIHQRILTEKRMNIIQQTEYKKILMMPTIITTNDNQLLHHSVPNDENDNQLLHHSVPNDENDNQLIVKNQRVSLKKPLSKLSGYVRHDSLSPLASLNNSPKVARKPKRTLSLKNFCNNLELPKIIVQDSSNKLPEIETLTPTTPVRTFLNLNDHYKLTCDHIERCKQRIQELDLCVKKLIEIYKQKIDENQKNIDFYWNLLKQTILAQIKHQSCTISTKELLKYLMCCHHSNSNTTNLSSFSKIIYKQQLLRTYLKNNDEINAALQVFYTNLVILLHQTPSQTSININNSYNLINQLFEREEQTTLKSIRKESAQTLGIYAQELEKLQIQVETQSDDFLKWKNSNIIELDEIKEQWSISVDVTYPKLIEKISTDFIQIQTQDETIVTMLKHIKQRIKENIQQQQKQQQQQPRILKSDNEC